MTAASAKYCSACGAPEVPPAAMTAVEPQPSSATVTEGWQMTGLASGRKQLGHARRDVPILRPIDRPVEWSPRELHFGIRVIELCIDAEDAGDAYVKVLGVDAKRVYETWQRVASLIGDGQLFGEQEPF